MNLIALRGRRWWRQWTIGKLLEGGLKHGKTDSHLQQPSFPSAAQGISEAEAKVLLLLRVSHHIVIWGQEATGPAGLRTEVSVRAQVCHSALLPRIYGECKVFF